MKDDLATKREKTRVRVAKWRAANPEKMRAASKRNRENNKATQKTCQKAWKKANPEKVKASNARWYAARKEAIRAAYATWKERMPITKSSTIL